ncbi:MAG: bifunctional phosphopantothenoylcysteine decarboxylase/phosphopantothenate--cysteine ligase CoaBC [Microcystaceae cyanobacterium]
MLAQRRILIGIGGGIAAYKVCEVISSLFKLGAEVRVILTETAQQFITPLTISTISRHPAYTDNQFWHPIHSRPLHIELGEWAEIMLIAPLTANTLAKLVCGLGDNLLTSTVLASRCPILLAPAMNTEMWEQISVQGNWHKIKENQRYHTIEPTSGLLACDRKGQGRLAEPSSLLHYLQSLLHVQGKPDLTGKHILVSAGGTREYLDAVRFIGNPSTGKMGIALAQAAFYRGATVTLVHAPIETTLLEQLPPCQRIRVESAAQMEKALLEVFPRADWTIMAAAVADVKPKSYTSQKLPKKDLPSALPLESVPDIVAQLDQIKRKEQKLIGFAAQTGDIIPPALDKLKRKNLDAIAANPIDKIDSGFGTDNNQVIFLDKEGNQHKIPHCSKFELAHQLLDYIRDLSKTY